MRIKYELREEIEAYYERCFADQIAGLVAGLIRCPLCAWSVASTGVETNRDNNIVVVFFHGIHSPAHAVLLKEENLVVRFQASDRVLSVGWDYLNPLGDDEKKEIQRRKLEANKTGTIISKQRQLKRRGSLK